MRWTASLIVALIVFGQSSEVASAGSAVSIAAGGNHTCAVLDTGLAKCWGWNNRGQLGTGTSESSPTPVGVKKISGATAIAAGYGHTCALLTSGQVKCWGGNGAGQLGNGTTVEYSSVPVTVKKLSGAIAIAAGSDHTCALVATARVRVKCWGNNFYGQLGDGTRTSRSIPVVVSHPGLTAAVAAGWGHTCALLQTGRLRCWGYNDSGQLGSGSKSGFSTTPVNVVNPSGIKYAAVAAGYFHSCAVTVSARGKCWGNNSDGELGIGSKTSQSEPVRVQGLSGVTAMAGGNGQSCAVSGNVAKCWGGNNFGQLGNGTMTESLTPVNVWGLAGVVGIATGQAHSCALKVGGVQCWGRNENGQLGDGTHNNRLKPVSVKGL